MPVHHHNLTAEDQATYKAWTRRILSAYGMAILLGLALVTIHSTVQTGEADKSMSGAVTLAAD
jgi:hypothetical protein